jgi:signal peptidase I
MRSPEMASRFVVVSSELLARGYGVRFRASGGSMRPAICDGDVITVEPAAPARLVPGSVIVYRQADRVFAHRLVSVGADDAGQERLLLRGDATHVCDAPISPAQVIGEVVAVRRGSARPGLRDVLEMVGRALRGRQRMTLWPMTSQQAL